MKETENETQSENLLIKRNLRDLSSLTYGWHLDSNSKTKMENVSNWGNVNMINSLLLRTCFHIFMCDNGIQYAEKSLF